MLGCLLLLILPDFRDLGWSIGCGAKAVYVFFEICVSVTVFVAVSVFWVAGIELVCLLPFIGHAVPVGVFWGRDALERKPACRYRRLCSEGISGFDLVDYHLEILLAVADASSAVFPSAEVHRKELFSLDNGLFGGGLE